MIGKTLGGRYKIIQELGSGGFGETFVATDIKLHDSPCVVKKLKPFSNDRETLKLARRLFELESKTLLRLDHSQIPRLLAYFEQNKNFFLVQELVQGHPLNEEIRAGEPWDVDAVVHFLASALKPLAHAHSKSVIHRDIKPANLMRRRIDGEVILIDFGAVKEVINSSRHGQAQAINTIPIGTPGYMPYEQSNSQPRFSSDIYALGVTCIEALTGRSATELEEDPQTFEILWRHLINIDPRLADILDRMVCYDFRQRYSSGEEALEALQTYIKFLPSPISSPASSYSPPAKFVNTYLDSLEIKSTQKVVASGVSDQTVKLPRKRSIKREFTSFVKHSFVICKSKLNEVKVAFAPAIHYLIKCFARIIHQLKHDVSPKSIKLYLLILAVIIMVVTGSVFEIISSKQKELDKNKIPALLQLWECEDVKNADEALVSCNKSIELNPEHPPSYEQRGLIKKKLEKNQEALADYNKAIELNPKLASAYEKRGGVKFDLGKKQEAMTDYNKAIEIDPKFASAYTKRGLLRYELKQEKEAMNDLNKSIEVDPYYSSAYVVRGFYEYHSGRKGQALFDLDKAIELDSEYAPSYVLRGNIKEGLGRKKDALSDYRQVAILYKQQGKTKEYKQALTRIEKMK